MYLLYSTYNCTCKYLSSLMYKCTIQLYMIVNKMLININSLYDRAQKCSIYYTYTKCIASRSLHVTIISALIGIRVQWCRNACVYAEPDMIAQWASHVKKCQFIFINHSWVYTWLIKQNHLHIYKSRIYIGIRVQWCRNACVYAEPDTIAQWASHVKNASSFHQSFMSLHMIN